MSAQELSSKQGASRSGKTRRPARSRHDRARNADRGKCALPVPVGPAGHAPRRIFGLRSHFLPELRVSAAEASLATLVLNDAADIRARLRRGNEWSAMVSATFIVDDAESLRVTELQYHPMAPPLESPYDDNDFEFIELENLGFDALNLTGVRLSGAARRQWRRPGSTRVTWYKLRHTFILRALRMCWERGASRSAAARCGP